MSLQTLYLLAIGFLIAMLFICYRNEMVYRIRARARNMLPIDRRYWELDAYVKSCGGYYAMVFDLRKWKFKQFYPELEERSRT